MIDSEPEKFASRKVFRAVPSCLAKYQFQNSFGEIRQVRMLLRGDLVMGEGLLMRGSSCAMATSCLQDRPEGA